jgi:hypothetical protein
LKTKIMMMTSEFKDADFLVQLSLYESISCTQGKVTSSLSASLHRYMSMVYTAQRIVGNITYEGVSKSFRTGLLERELQTVQLSATRCSCITIV